ncbi:MAG: type II toxin-antitoxin system Phd/YefM family antitoxin [Erysipelotrichaceae bacterium]|nr:type II toxin-antitoxin system Phd/YefM family antitoxin [Erysipelotrichaceae bacterium]
MIALNYSQFRENMKTYMDNVCDDYETLTITRKDNRNVVVISEEAYNNLLENVYIMSNKANYDWLMESLKQLEEGRAERHELIEVSDE